MKVTTIAHTITIDHNIKPHFEGDAFHTIDHLSEFAGRACYQSFDKPNPATASNADYLRNIQDQGHYSVLEHGSVSFYVQHASRALLLELERHRHISFSVESQRYVKTANAHPEPVIPPAFRGNERLTRMLRKHYGVSLLHYDRAYADLRDKGLSVKEAREAARAFLPNATPVDFVVTGNMRAWRDVLGKRWHDAADAEIREFAGLVLNELREIAPHSMQDIPVVPYE